MKLRDHVRAYLRERTGFDASRPIARMPGGASFAYVFGKVLVFLLLVEALSGAALAAFYSPSSTDAWASVAYIQDQAALGWLVRGLHHHGGSALVIIAGIHLLQTAIAGAYKKPRELVWWLGIVLLVLTLAWAVTGYVLRWDQAGYWANKVEIGIAAGTPVIGEAIRKLALGGNDYGNLTLTRFYALHVIVLPALVTVITIAHVVLARRHGVTPVRDREAVPRWPEQTLRDVIAMTVVFVILLAYVVSQHGADLAAPADPAQAYDARPLWYFRWLFELRQLAGSAEKIVAMVVPAIVAGFLVALPLLDKVPERAPRRRLLWLGGVAGLFAVIGALTLVSLASDEGDEALATRRAKAATSATRARTLAVEHGVPVTGPGDLEASSPMYVARSLFATRCASCHDDGSKDRKGPIIAPGHGGRGWLAGFLQAPSGDPYWGRSKLAQTEVAMKPVELPPDQLADLIEYLYSESGAADVDAPRRARGAAIFDSTCTDCHSREDGVAGAAGPSLAGLGSRNFYTSFIGNPKSPIHMGSDNSQMPRFDKELSLIERDAIAEYLVWLRTATPAELAALGTR